MADPAVVQHDAVVAIQQVVAQGGPVHRLLQAGHVVRMHTLVPQRRRSGPAAADVAEQLVHAGVPDQLAAGDVALPDADAAALGGERDAVVDLLDLQPLRDLVADVLERADQPHRDAGGELGRTDGAHPQAAAVAADERQLDVPRRAVGHRRPHGLLDRRAGFRCVELERALQVGYVVGIDAVDAPRLARPDDVAGDEIHFPTADARHPSGAVEEQLALAQGLFLQLAFGDVERHRKVADDAASGVDIGNDVLLHPFVATLDVRLHLETAQLAAQRGLDMRVDMRPFLLAAERPVRRAHQRRRIDAVQAPHVLVRIGADRLRVHAHDGRRQVVGDGAQAALAEFEPGAAVHQRRGHRGAQPQLAQHEDRAGGHRRQQQQQRDVGPVRGGAADTTPDGDAFVEAAAFGGHHRGGEALDVAFDLLAGAVDHEGAGLVRMRGHERDGLG